MKPPQYLKADDVVELGIDKLGKSRQRVVAWQPVIAAVGAPSER
jgi:2-keto-4-pentenoate hydratase/2-oxohepta-3-ene-1,7-dioic acid hydratase in catechol pathway